MPAHPAAAASVAARAAGLRVLESLPQRQRVFLHNTDCAVSKDDQTGQHVTVPVDQSTARETLYEAARLVGGLDNLSRIVDTKKAHLVAYGAGLVAIPQGLFLKLADVVTENRNLNPTTVSLGEQHAIVQRIFLRAAERIGGDSALCPQSKRPYAGVRTKLNGRRM